MDETEAQDGHKNGRVYVKFGPHPTDEMPLEWAEKMLTEWRNSHPSQFGRQLADVVSGAK